MPWARHGDTRLCTCFCQTGHTATLVVLAGVFCRNAGHGSTTKPHFDSYAPRPYRPRPQRVYLPSTTVPTIDSPVAIPFARSFVLSQSNYVQFRGQIVWIMPWPTYQKRSVSVLFPFFIFSLLCVFFSVFNQYFFNQYCLAFFSRISFTTLITSRRNVRNFRGRAAPWWL